jgi:predicted metalloprotease with PDZ domain
VDEAVVAFLVDGELPGDLTCRPDRSVGVAVEPAGDAYVVVAVDPEGPAAGIVQPGDLVLALNGEPFQLEVALALEASGEPFVATIQRGDEVFDVEAAGQYPPYWRP